MQVTELIDEYNAREKFVAAAIIEPIQAEGGEFGLRISVSLFSPHIDTIHFNSSSCINNFQSSVKQLLSGRKFTQSAKTP